MPGRSDNKIESCPSEIREWRTPDIGMSCDFTKAVDKVIETCRELGLDGFDFLPQFFLWDEISELAAYGGFPVRYPHYLFGMEFEHLQQSYKYGYSKIFEMIVNNDPSYAFLLNSNSDVDNLTVIAHAYAHNDFFKNNVWFSKTNRNMMNEMANHGIRIRRYCTKYGRDKAINFLDLALSIQFLIDPSDVFKQSGVHQISFADPVSVEEPRKLPVRDGGEYMDSFINPEDFVNGERERIKCDFARKQNRVPERPTRDVIGFIAKYSPRLQSWMRDILCTVRKEALYLWPQMQTKILNEGWASYWDEQVMAKHGFAGDAGIVEYARHHAAVQGGKYSTNPYKLGYMLLCWVKERWDKGRFGPEWEECKDRERKKSWDTKAGLGTEKLFEIRERYNDQMLIDEFFDQDFVDENEFFLWEKRSDGSHVCVSKDAKDIKKVIDETYISANVRPIIKVRNANFLNMHHLLLEHTWTGRTIDMHYAEHVVKFMSRLWGGPVALMTYDTANDFEPDVPPDENEKIAHIMIYSVNGQLGSWTTMDKYKQMFNSTK